MAKSLAIVEVRPLSKVEPGERLTYTVQEAARILGVGRNSCYEAVQRGEIPSLRVGRRLLIPKAALERLLTQQR